jgi:serine/threonine protein kinase
MNDPLDMRSLEGTVIAGRYRLRRYLNQGGFGAVYQASHLAFGMELREVAVKVGKRPMTDSEAREMFGDAIRLAEVAIKCPDPALRDHFVAVYDAGRCPEGGPLAGHPYMVMEFIQGGSLKTCLRAGPFPLTRAVAYFDQIVEAVAFMHTGCNIIHRDLKPDNILVTRPSSGPDRIKVTDFGLAIKVDSLLGWVQSGGDLAYLAPESFSHDISSPQSDVYMLGLVFYEMLTNTNPFAEVGSHLRGTDAEKRDELRRLHLNARQQESFPLLERHEEIRLQPALGQVIRAALAPEMTARKYANARELQMAWTAAKTAGGRLETERPWETVLRLTERAEQQYALADWGQGDSLLLQAMELNRDRSKVPESMVVGKTYLLQVRTLIRKGQVDDAGRLASEGFQCHPCRSTRLALAAYFETIQSPLAARWEQEADACQGQE